MSLTRGKRFNDVDPPSNLHYPVFWSGTLETIHHALYVKCREQAEREANPSACILDSQSVRSAEKGGRVSIPMGLMGAS